MALQKATLNLAETEDQRDNAYRTITRTGYNTEMIRQIEQLAIEADELTR
jgi:hypothetical protein